MPAGTHSRPNGLARQTTALAQIARPRESVKAKPMLHGLKAGPHLAPRVPHDVYPWRFLVPTMPPLLVMPCIYMERRIGAMREGVNRGP